jgi:hypothetical protein
MIAAASSAPPFRSIFGSCRACARSPIGLVCDGLVWLDDHSPWFPECYRVLANLVGDDRR